jgi:hypothetical protein
MRRLLLVVLMVIVGLGLTAMPASAGSLRVRVDPNDSSSNIDIHKVITNLSRTTMYLRLRSWERFHAGEMRENWAFVIDTYGTPRFDRYVDIAHGQHGILCTVFKGQVLHAIGHRHATRPDGRSAACHLPRAWFGHIDRAVRFSADIAFATSRGAEDAAPDHGVYRWI